MKNILFLIVFLALSFVPFASAQASENLVGFVATDAPINVRERPSANGRVMATLPPNYSVGILRQSEDGAWYEVQVAEGQTGWVSASLLRVLESAIPADLVEITPENAAQLEEITQLAATLSTGFAFSPDGRLLASYSWEGVVEIYDVRSKILITTLTAHTGVVTDVAFSPDGSELATAGWDTTVNLWNTQSWGERTSFVGHTESVAAIAYSPDGTKIASAGTDDKLIIWDVQTGERLLEIEHQIYQPLNLAFSPDGTKIAAVGDYYDSYLRVWDAATGEELWNKYLGGNLHLAFTPDGTSVVVQSGSGAQIHGFDTESGLENFSIIGRTGGNGGSSIDINPAGNLIAGGGWSTGVFFLMDITSETLIFSDDSQAGQRSSAIAVGFSPDGRILVTSDSFASIRIWGVHGA